MHRTKLVIPIFLRYYQSIFQSTHNLYSLVVKSKLSLDQSSSRLWISDVAHILEGCLHDNCPEHTQMDEGGHAWVALDDEGCR